MLEPDLVRDLLAAALSTGGRFAELFAEERDSVAIRLDDGRIEEVVAGSDRGAGIRVFHGESQAYAFSNRLDPGSLRQAAAAAASAVRGAAARVAAVDLRASDVVLHPERRPASDVPVEEKVGWLRSVDQAARGVVPSVRPGLAAPPDTRPHMLRAR